MSKISVIIPVYNTQNYLKQCLDSVINQTYKDLEIICINDGSTDASETILKEYAQNDARIKILTQENMGLSMARNKGLDIATGEWICFVDSDDALPENALEILYGIAEKTGVSLVASRQRFDMSTAGANWKACDLPMTYSVHKNGLADFVQDNKIFSSVWNKLFRADLFHDVRFQAGMLYEDWPVMTFIFSKVPVYATTEVPCYTYRDNNVSITRSSFSQQKVDSYLKGIDIVCEQFRNTAQWPWAQRRLAVAIKMLVNKVFHSKNKELSKYMLVKLEALFITLPAVKKLLPFKTRWRLWCLKHM